MKTFMKIFAVIATMVAMMACQKIEIYHYSDGWKTLPYYQPYCVPQNAYGEYGIVFGNYSPATKATSNAGVFVGPGECGYDAFDIYAYKDGSEAVMNPYTVTWNGSAWSYETSPQELQYFSRNSTKYDFIGVISDKASAWNAGTVEVDDVEAFLDNTDELNTPAELLWAGTEVVKANYGSTVPLTFNHANAKMYIGFASDRADTEVLDYTPSTPEVPATPDTETYTSESVQFLDELVAGHSVQVPIGFVGSSSPKLTATNPTSLYIGTNNATYNYYAKDWLLSIKDAVNAQFVYYRLDAVASSTSKIETTEDWESKVSNKKLYMMKLADGVNAADFAAGNDVFWNALVAHENDWVGGNPATSFKDIFAAAYAQGWRVIRINTNIAYKTFPTDMTVESTNANEVYVFLANNSTVTTQVCTITPGTPYQPAVAGLDGIRVFSVDKDANDKFVVTNHTTKADAAITISDCTLTVAESADDVFQFAKPTGVVAQFPTMADVVVANSTFSPTTYYALPIGNPAEGYVVKFSYTYNGKTYYDARVHIPGADANFAQGWYYKYVIYITSATNGTEDPNEASTDKDEVDTSDSPIRFNVVVSRSYDNGLEQTYQL